MICFVMQAPRVSAASGSSRGRLSCKPLVYSTWGLLIITTQVMHGLQGQWGSLYRSTGQNINGPNINELQVNCSIGQQKPVDV